MLWVVASFFWSVDGPTSYERIETFLQLLGLVLITWDLCDSIAAVRATLQAYVLGASVALAFLFVSFASGAQEYHNRFTSLDASPGWLAVTLALGMPIAWYLSLHAKGQLGRWFNRGYLPAAAFGIALSGSRAGLIAGAVALLFVPATFPRLKRSVVLGSVVAIAVSLLAILVLVPDRTLDRLASIGDELATGDLSGREGIWRDGLAGIVERPFLGSGAGTIRSVTSSGALGHNMVVEIGAELGMVGLVLMGAILFVSLRRATVQPHLHRLLWLTVLGIWAVGAMAQNVDHAKATWLLHSLIVASAAAGSRLRASVPGFKFETTGSFPAGQRSLRLKGP